jgi:hypothetical protein
LIGEEVGVFDRLVSRSRLEPSHRDDVLRKLGIVHARAAITAAQSLGDYTMPEAYTGDHLVTMGVGLTAKAIAELHGVGLPAVKQRLRRGRMMLVSALARGNERREALEGVPLSCWEARPEELQLGRQVPSSKSSDGSIHGPIQQNRGNIEELKPHS